MSTQLEQLGIALRQGYAPEHISADCDEIVVGNALSRGNAAVEQVLDDGRRYTSGAQWLGETRAARPRHARGRRHPRQDHDDHDPDLPAGSRRAATPGFLIGGVAEDFGVSARIGGGREFVVEADEYDTAFFDKRSKFVHYRPLVAILNNLEYDHADIFPDVAAIQRQFHHLVRTVPRRGRLIVNGEDRHLAEVLAMGCWTPVETFGLDASLLPQSTQRETHGDRADEQVAARAAFDWTARLINEDGSAFAVVHDGVEVGEVHWPLLGRHNVMNALAALAAAHAVGVDVADGAAGAGAVPQRQAPAGSASARRDGVTIYDDFAHHPTAIATTLAGLRAKVGDARIVVAMEPRSNSMRLGAHADALAPSLDIADAVVFLHRPGTGLGCRQGRRRAARRRRGRARRRCADRRAARTCARGDHVVFMSNGGFDGAPRRFLAVLQQG